MKDIVEARGVSKFFGTSRALDSVDLTIARGECLGLVGHNGAGKSTLMNVLAGIFPPSEGGFSVAGRPQGGEYDVHAANKLGVRAIFQELSLCLNLTVVENMRIFHPEFSGYGWRRRAARSIQSTLDEIFPGHGVKPGDRVGNLTLGQRQTLEIAKAFAGGGHPLRLLILDEPTSALDYHTAKQLLEHIRRNKGGDVSFVYISHMLDEVLECADRIAVMRDGRISGETAGADATRERLIELMGSARTAPQERAVRARRESELAGRRLLVEPRRGAADGKRITLREGEVVGLAGLAGHGQTDLLTDLFDYRSNDEYRIEGPLTFVPGDRQRDGVFPLWSIVNNLTIMVYHRVKRYNLIDLRLEHDVSGRWRDSIAIKAASLKDNILSLSGGNQQKVLFARCLESDSKIILMDDPTRGVDVGTKDIIYRLIFEESGRGRSFVWYTTEMDELKYCDRVYIFKDGEIVAEMPGEDATEEAVLRSSF